jgi:hypothetical protein
MEDPNAVKKLRLRVFVLFAIMEDPIAVENNRFSVFIEFDSELNT